MKVYVLRRKRTEHARLQRRLTGTNAFSDKVFDVNPGGVSNTITTTPSVDNLIMQIEE